MNSAPMEITATIDSAGTINGELSNQASINGTVVSLSGVIDGGLSNEASIDNIDVDSSGVINGCLNNESLLDAVLSNSYFKGDKGDKGDRGDKGDKGDTGNSIITYAETHFEFPNIGSKDNIYIARGEGAIYYWNDDAMSYVCVGNNVEYIKIINGGSAYE